MEDDESTHEGTSAINQPRSPNIQLPSMDGDPQTLFARGNQNSFKIVKSHSKTYKMK